VKAKGDPVELFRYPMNEIKGLDEWGYGGGHGSNVDIYTHDSGTAQIRVRYKPDEQYEYQIRFQFEGGDGIIEVTAYDTERTDTWKEAEDAVREFVQFFDEEIEERYYTIG
jgi:hypothetical protein